MKFKLTSILTVAGVLALAQVPPPPPSNLMSFTITHLDQTADPMVEFMVPDAETNELVFNNQTNITYSAAGQKTVCYVGCTNITEIAWQTKPGINYGIWVRTNSTDNWTYTRMRVVGFGALFKLYSIADQNRQFLIKPY